MITDGTSAGHVGISAYVKHVGLQSGPGTRAGPATATMTDAG